MGSILYHRHILKFKLLNLLKENLFNSRERKLCLDSAVRKIEMKNMFKLFSAFKSSLSYTLQIRHAKEKVSKRSIRSATRKHFLRFRYRFEVANNLRRHFIEKPMVIKKKIFNKFKQDYRDVQEEARNDKIAIRHSNGSTKKIAL